MLFKTSDYIKFHNGQSNAMNLKPCNGFLVSSDGSMNHQLVNNEESIDKAHRGIMEEMTSSTSGDFQQCALVVQSVICPERTKVIDNTIDVLDNIDNVITINITRDILEKIPEFDQIDGLDKSEKRFNSDRAKKSKMDAN